MLKFKKGCKIYGLQPEMLWAIDRCNEMFQAQGKDCTVTSARGDMHSTKSRHGSGLAFDLRCRNLTADQRQRLATDISVILGDSFDFVDEGDHWHIEYDPRNAFIYPTVLIH